MGSEVIEVVERRRRWPIEVKLNAVTLRYDRWRPALAKVGGDFALARARCASQHYRLK